MRDRLTAAADIAVRVQMKDVVRIFARVCVPKGGSQPRAEDSDPEILGVFARSWVTLAPDEAVPVLSRTLTEAALAPAYRESLTEILAAQNTPAAQAACVAGLKAMPPKSQEKVAYTVATTPHGAETLLAALENGAVSARVLQRIG